MASGGQQHRGRGGGGRPYASKNKSIFSYYYIILPFFSLFVSLFVSLFLGYVRNQFSIYMYMKMMGLFSDQKIESYGSSYSSITEDDESKVRASSRISTSISFYAKSN